MTDCRPMAATINPGGGPFPAAVPAPWQRPRRPAVLDASRAALIPLRPLTISEMLDAAFLVVRRNARLMIGLPLVIAGGAGAYLLGGIGIWFLLSNTTEDWAQILAVVLYGLLGLLLLTMSLVWMTAVLSGLTLQTVLGHGFAPPTAVSLRRSLRLFWPMMGLSLLQWVAGSILQSVISILYYLALLGTLINSDQLGPAITIIVTVIGYLLLAAAYSYISLTVPAFATENKHAPAWIGKPQRPTNILTAFERSFKLIGLRNLPRATLIMAGGMAISTHRGAARRHRLTAGRAVVRDRARGRRPGGADQPVDLHRGRSDSLPSWRCRPCWRSSPPCRPCSISIFGCAARGWTWRCASTAYRSRSRPRHRRSSWCRCRRRCPRRRPCRQGSPCPRRRFRGSNLRGRDHDPVGHPGRARSGRGPATGARGTGQDQVRR